MNPNKYWLETLSILERCWRAASSEDTADYEYCPEIIRPRHARSWLLSAQQHVVEINLFAVTLHLCQQVESA